jgi:hypothetical protein
MESKTYMIDTSSDKQAKKLLKKKQENLTEEDILI